LLSRQRYQLRSVGRRQFMLPIVCIQAAPQAIN
jgi:hypothetical protein